MDDGSRSAEMSAEMITRLEEQGVKNIVLTPHFYASHGSVDHFLKKREKSLALLKEAMADRPAKAEIYLGAEVFFMDSLDRVEGFKRMAIGGSNYLLLEMPFSEWTERTLETVYRIISAGITPIIAHFERYISIQGGMKKIYELKRMGCILQMNAESFNGFLNKRRALKFFAEGTASLLGSDCHNLTARTPEIRFAYDCIEKKLGSEAVENIIRTGDRILERADKITW